MKILKASLFLLAFFVLAAPASLRANDEMLHDQVMIRTEAGEEFYFNVEMALTGSEHARGLMNRSVLEQGSGMLFVFSGEAQRSFWMKDTLIPLDMLFLSHDGSIHHIHQMAKPQDKTQISSKRPSKAVLEINGGLADQLGIKAGDKVIHSVFRNKLDQ